MGSQPEMTSPPQGVWFGNGVQPAVTIDSLIANSVSLSAFEDVQPSASYQAEQSQGAQSQTDLSQAMQSQAALTQAGPMVLGDAQPSASFRAAQSQAGSTQADITVLEKAPEISPYTSILNDITPLIPIENFVQKMITVINMGCKDFSPMQWAEIHLIDNEEALRECEVLYATGLADRYIRRGRFIYLFRFETCTELASLAREGRIRAPENMITSKEAVFWTQLALLEASKSDAMLKAALTVRQMISEGVTEYTKTDWIDRTGMNDTVYKNCRSRMLELGLIRNLNKRADNRAPGVGLFRFTLVDDCDNASLEESSLGTEEEGSLRTEDNSLGADSVDSDFIQWVPPYREMTVDEFLQTLSQNETSSVMQRIYKYLSMKKGGLPFTSYDWMCYFNISNSVAKRDVHRAFNMGLLEMVDNTVKGDYSQYRLTTRSIPTLHIDDLMDEKKVHLQKLYDRFNTDAFLAQDACDVFDVKRTSIPYRMEEFIGKRYIIPRRDKYRQM